MSQVEISFALQNKMRGIIKSPPFEMQSSGGQEQRAT